MFGSIRNSVTPYFTGSADGTEYWDDLDDRHDQHRRNVRNLLIAVAVIVVLAVVIEPVVLAFLVVLAPLLLLELWMVRRSRPTSRIPDFRPPDMVEIELDEP